MKWTEGPRFYRRPILIYLAAIIAPACVLVWLGIKSFERQHDALAALAAEKLAAAVEAATRVAATKALDGWPEPVSRHSFTIEDGRVVRPALISPPREEDPIEFLDAVHQELSLHRPDMALEFYRKLSAAHQHESLALAGMARCLTKLGRTDEARVVWKKLASNFPDDRDLSHRPFGILAAIEAGDTAGLYDKIASGRWELSADQAEFFLTKLDPDGSTPYLDQFRFAKELNDQFRSQGTVRQGELQSYTFGKHRVFYRDNGDGRVTGFEVNEEWVNGTLRPQIEKTLGFSDLGKSDLRVYGGAMGSVLLILSAGIALLLRDLSREAKANRFRSDLVSSVSHELKTPITLIRLYGETLLDRSGLGLEERVEFCRIIVRESERLTRLVNQVLTFSRIERGSQVYTLEEGDLASAIGAIVRDYRGYLERTGFTVAQSWAESTPPVRFDETALTQAVVNLLENASKYSGTSREIALRLHATGENVMFEVEDHGVGIPSAEQEKIFERFYRVSNGSGKGGYGLGLFLVRHIMDAHGGRAEVEREPGRGSCFRLVFPAVG